MGPRSPSVLWQAPTSGISLDVWSEKFPRINETKLEASPRFYSYLLKEREET